MKQFEIQDVRKLGFVRRSVYIARAIWYEKYTLRKATYRLRQKWERRLDPIVFAIFAITHPRAWGKLREFRKFVLQKRAAKN